MLIDRGADANSRNNHAEAPLQNAAFNGSFQIIA